MPLGLAFPGVLLTDPALPGMMIGPKSDLYKLTELRLLIDANPEIGEAGLFVDADLIGQRLNEFRAMIPNGRPTFDMATLDDPAVVEFIASLGTTLSASSGYHVKMCKLLGVPSEAFQLTSPAIVWDMITSAVENRPSVISVDDIDSLRLYKQVGVFSIPEYQPALAIHVRTGDQPYINPLKVHEVIELAREYGVKSFHIATTVNTSQHDVSNMNSALDAALLAIQTASRKNGVTIDGVHIGGGMMDPRTLIKSGIAPAHYLSKIDEAIQSFKSKTAEFGFANDVSVDAGRWLIGESCIVAKVTGTRVDEGQFQVFICDSRYGGLNRSMYDGEHIDVAVVPRSNLQLPTGDLVATVVQGASCDSVDKLPNTHLIPQNISAGHDGNPADWVACFSTGANSVSSGLDFNMIELPGVVLHRKRSGTIECAHSPFIRKQKLLLDAAHKWNEHGRRTSEMKKVLSAMPSEHFKFREGRALAGIHIDQALPALRNIFATSKRQNEQQMIRRGFLFQDGVQVLTTIEALLDYTKVDSLCIAQKAQNDPTVVALESVANFYLELRGKGAREGCPKRVMMDTASAGEMYLAAAMGFPASEMIVSHPHKTELTLQAIRELRPWAWTFDSEQELQRVIAMGAGHVQASATTEAYDPTVLVRIKASGIGSKNNLSSKFGCDVNTAVSLLKSAQDKGFKKFGVAFHVGTQCCRPASYAEALSLALNVITIAKDLGIEVSVVDIGGGFPDSQAARAAKTSHLSLLQKIGDVVTAFRDATQKVTGKEIFIVSEPGRIISYGGTIISPIIKAQMNSSSTIAHLRIAEFGRGGLSGATHDEQTFEMRILPGIFRETGFKFSDREAIYSKVYGATGFASDEFINRSGVYAFSSSVRASDYIVIPGTGAYSSSAGANVAGHEPSGAVLGLPNGYWCSPWYSKNKIYLEALAQHANTDGSFQ